MFQSFIRASLLVMVWPATAMAFEYTEHRTASNDVVDKMCTATAGKGFVCQSRNALMAVLQSGNASAVPDFGDLVAMSGDHSVSPPSLVWRMYSNGAPGTWLKLDVFRVIPEKVAQRPLDLDQFLAKVRSWAFTFSPTGSTEAEWQTCRDDKKAIYDGSLLKLRAVDVDYLANASANETHFRAPATNAAEELWSRYNYCLVENVWQYVVSCRPYDRSKPSRNAVSMYGDLHAGALHFARLAKQGGAPGQLASASLLLEAYSLHYLQDSVSAGHLAKTSLSSKAARRAYHDRVCQQGLDVVLPREAASALRRSDTPHRIFGDGALWCIGGQHVDDRRVTAAYAELVTMTSLQELDRAFNDTQWAADADLLSALGSDKPCEPNNVQAELRPLYSAVCQWWEPAPTAPLARRPGTIQELYNLKYFAAFKLLPLPR